MQTQIVYQHITPTASQFLQNYFSQSLVGQSDVAAIGAAFFMAFIIIAAVINYQATRMTD